MSAALATFTSVSSLWLCVSGSMRTTSAGLVALDQRPMRKRPCSGAWTLVYTPIFENESCDLMAALFRLAAAPDAAGRSVPVVVKGSAQGPIEKTEQHLQRNEKGETVVTPVQPSGGEPAKPPP